MGNPDCSGVGLNTASSEIASRHILTRQQPAVIVFAIGMVGLGILALVYGDFALVWQPVPPGIPGRTALAYTCGALMLLAGIGLVVRRTAPWSARVLLPYLFAWTLLKVPAVVVAPQVEAVWLGLGELTVLLAGGWVLFAKLAGVGKQSTLGFLASERSLRAARILFGISLIPIGFSHLVYSKETADLVPAWLPFRIGWAYLTGAGHIAAGIGVLFSIYSKLAATLEAGMIGLFTFLVWFPAIVAAPKERLPWTAFFISWAIGSAAWVVAQSILAGKATEARQGSQQL